MSNVQILSVLFKNFSHIKRQFVKSNYMPKYIVNGLKNFREKIKGDTWILCPVYQRKDKSLEFQFGVTGKAKFNETSKQAVKREVSEELSLHINMLKLQPVYSDSVFAVNIQDCKSGEKLRNFDRDNKNVRIGCFVYGKTEEIVDYFDYLSASEKPKGEDNIVGIVAAKIDDIVKSFKNEK